MIIVTRPEEVTEAKSDDLVQALEDKYDALRDKLIADALIQQVGESEWKAMSERDRMAKLVQMKLEAKRLKKEGVLRYCHGQIDFFFLVFLNKWQFNWICCIITPACDISVFFCPGKIDELQKIFGDSLANEANLASLMGENKASYEKRLQERLAKRRERLDQGMDQSDVDRLEAEEDKKFEEEVQSKSSGNALLDLEV